MACRWTGAANSPNKPIRRRSESRPAVVAAREYWGVNGVDAGGRTGFWREVMVRAKPWLWFTGKAFITVALLALILRAVDMDQVWARVQAFSFLFLIPLAAVMIGQTVVTTVRWQLVMAALDVAIGFTKAWLILLIGMFFNQSLPSTIGGDVVRIWRVHCEGHGLGKSANVVLVDRVMALAGLMVLVAPALPVLYAIGNGSGGAIVLSMAVAVALVSMGMALFFVIPGLPALVGRWRPLRAVAELMMDARSLIADPGRALVITAIAVVVHGLSATAVYVLARGFHVEATWLDCLLLVPAVVLVMVLPISIAGWGLREGAMVSAFALVGVPVEDSLVLSVGFGLATMAVGLPGAFIWLLTGRSRLAQPAS